MRQRLPRGQRKKECSKCNNLIEENRINHSRYCRLCGNYVLRTHRKKHSELSEEDRKKANCRSYVNVYIRRGKIKKESCVICKSNIKIQAHHLDYNKPLEVIWLCKDCHYKAHQDKELFLKISQQPKAIILSRKKIG